MEPIDRPVEIEELQLTLWNCGSSPLLSLPSELLLHIFNLIRFPDSGDERRFLVNTRHVCRHISDVVAEHVHWLNLEKDGQRQWRQYSDRVTPLGNLLWKYYLHEAFGSQPAMIEYGLYPDADEEQRTEALASPQLIVEPQPDAGAFVWDLISGVVVKRFCKGSAVPGHEKVCFGGARWCQVGSCFCSYSNDSRCVIAYWPSSDDFTIIPYSTSEVHYSHIVPVGSERLLLVAQNRSHSNNEELRLRDLYHGSVEAFCLKTGKSLWNIDRDGRRTAKDSSHPCSSYQSARCMAASEVFVRSEANYTSSGPQFGIFLLETGERIGQINHEHRADAYHMDGDLFYVLDHNHDLIVYDLTRQNDFGPISETTLPSECFHTLLQTQQTANGNRENFEIRDNRLVLYHSLKDGGDWSAKLSIIDIRTGDAIACDLQNVPHGRLEHIGVAEYLIYGIGGEVGGPRELCLWDIQTGDRLASFKVASPYILSVRLLGDRLFCTDYEGNAQIIHIPVKQPGVRYVAPPDRPKLEWKALSFKEKSGSPKLPRTGTVRRLANPLQEDSSSSVASTASSFRQSVVAQRNQAGQPAATTSLSPIFAAGPAPHLSYRHAITGAIAIVLLFGVGRRLWPLADRAL